MKVFQHSSLHPLVRPIPADELNIRQYFNIGRAENFSTIERILRHPYSDKLKCYRGAGVEHGTMKETLNENGKQSEIRSFVFPITCLKVHK